ncbi:MAG TPA: FtsX-like permease family protein [Sumerlaeia bacterium]|nr:FtsX-like permease family protein [Sumerlaeia bacterium]
MADCQALARGKHRLTGTNECLEASRYVEARLRDIGIKRIIPQEFLTAQTRVKRCEIELTDPRTGEAKTLPLEPMRANGVIPPVTPPEGIAGPLLHAGAGAVGDFIGRSPRGAVVVLDYNAGRAWMRAFRLGAKAVVFVRNEPTLSDRAHFTEANANFPRFYYAGNPLDLTEGTTATVRSEIVWESVTGRNVHAFVEGTDPVFDQEEEEVIVLAAHLDSYGEVPTLSPGARGAANCASLLLLAESLKAHPPRRHVLLSFFDGQARGHAGATAFYRALEQKDNLARVGARREHLEREKRFLEDMNKESPESERSLSDISGLPREMVTRLGNKAAEHAHEVGSEVYRLRREADSLRKSGLDPSAPEIAEIEGSIEEIWEPRKNEWNALRRALGRGDTRECPAGVRKALDLCLEEVRQDLLLRAQELVLEERALNADAELQDLLGNRWISLHVSLVLGDASPTWGVVIGGDSILHTLADNAGLYGRIQNAFSKAFEEMRGNGAAPRRFEIASAHGSINPTRFLMPAPFLVHGGEVAGMMGIYNLVLGTCHERLAREGAPDDTLEALNLDRIEKQASDVAALFSAVADSPLLSLRRSIVPGGTYALPEFDGGRAYGPMVMGKMLGSAMPNKPMSRVIVQLVPPAPIPPYPMKHEYQEKKPIAFDNFVLLRTNLNGSYGYGPLFLGMRGFAAAFDERGAVIAASDTTSGITPNVRLNAFDCRSGALVLPAQVFPKMVQVMRASSDAALDLERSNCDVFDGVVFWHCESKIRDVKLFGLESLIALANGPEDLRAPERGADASSAGSEEAREAQAGGVGFSMEKPWAPMNSAKRSASDLWRLNESRMEVLRSHQILNSSIESLHGRAEGLLQEASRWDSSSRAEALASSAFMIERHVYASARAVLDDLVHAVLVLLALAVPFAFVLERLLIGAANIYRQVAWFVCFFTITFLVLFFSHPAFAIAKTPIVIFLGFAVLVLSSLVILVIMRRFESELKVLQGMASTVHTADVSRINTVIAAMSMGISTMRRRPLRTALTATTIILLTFTILCFASFGPRTGIIRILAAPSPDYKGVMVHHVSWVSLGEEFLDIVEGRRGEPASGPDEAPALCRRYWISPVTDLAGGPLIASLARAHASEPSANPERAGAESRPFVLQGLLGIDAQEVKCRPDLASLMGDATDLQERVRMTRALANHLNVKEGDTVLIGGLSLRVGPLLNSSRLSAATDMDGSRFLPVDFTEMSLQQQLGAQAVSEQILAKGPQNWASLPTDSIAIVSAENAKALGAKLHAVMLYTKDAHTASALAEDLARILPFPVVATRTDGVYRHLLGTVLKAAGARDLLFPILLGGLVVFGTMLGSVEDRTREIYTFSALGLAPPHVASLFFAEALVYSVMGGLAGYLIAQGSLKALSYLASFGVVRVPEINYSSTNAIVTILIVMATVLLSALYPAIKASRSANPGILRSWRLPAPDGDTLDITFPFTVSEYDITGVVSFLKEHFDNCQDVGLGVFMSRDARLVRGKDNSLGVDTHLVLAPFDLGVTQSFQLRSAPSEIPGIEEVKIVLRRLSGQPKDWRRLNKVLLDNLRKQFLIWRSLPQETMEVYRRQTLTTTGEPASEDGQPARKR